MPTAAARTALRGGWGGEGTTLCTTTAAGRGARADIPMRWGSRGPDRPRPGPGSEGAHGHGAGAAAAAGDGAVTQRSGGAGLGLGRWGDAARWREVGGRSSAGHPGWRPPGAGGTDRGRDTVRPAGGRGPGVHPAASGIPSAGAVRSFMRSHTRSQRGESSGIGSLGAVLPAGLAATLAPSGVVRAGRRGAAAAGRASPWGAGGRGAAAGVRTHGGGGAAKPAWAASRLPPVRRMTRRQRPAGGSPAIPRRRGEAVPGEAAPRLSQPAALPPAAPPSRLPSLPRPVGAVRGRSPRPRPAAVGAAIAPPSRAAASVERWGGGGGPSRRPLRRRGPAAAGVPRRPEEEEDAGGTLKGASPAHPRPLSRAPSPAPGRRWWFPQGLRGVGPRHHRPRREGLPAAAVPRAGRGLRFRPCSTAPGRGGPRPPAPSPPDLCLGAPPLPPGGFQRIPNARANWDGLSLSHVLAIVINSCLAFPVLFFFFFFYRVWLYKQLLLFYIKARLIVTWQEQCSWWEVWSWMEPLVVSGRGDVASVPRLGGFWWAPLAGSEHSLRALRALAWRVNAFLPAPDFSLALLVKCGWVTKTLSLQTLTEVVSLKCL